MKNNKKRNILFPLLHFLGLACLLISYGSPPGQQTEQNTSGNLAAYCDARTQDFLNQKENAVLLEYRRLGEAEESCLCKDSETIASFLDALAAITVTEETSLVSSDDSDLFLFTDADGETYSFSFNSHHFEHGGTQYELSGDAALWRLTDDLRTQDKTLEGSDKG